MSDGWNAEAWFKFKSDQRPSDLLCVFALLFLPTFLSRSMYLAKDVFAF